MESILRFNSKIADKKIGLSFFPFIVSLASFCLNILFVFNPMFSYINVGVQALLLLLLFLSKKYGDFLGLYMVFLASSMEFGYFLGTENFYGFKNIRIAGLNLGLLVIVPLFIVALINFKSITSYLRGKRSVNNTLLAWLFFCLIAFLVGFVGIIINDNNIAQLPNVYVSFLKEAYMWFAFPLMVAVCALFVASYSKYGISKLKEYLLILIVCFLISVPFSYLFGERGFYGNVKTLIISNIYFLCPLFLLVPLFLNLRLKILYYALCFAALAFILLYNANGKIILLLALVFLYYLIFAWKLLKTITARIVFVIILVFSLVAGVFIISRVYSTNFLLQNKIEQTFSLIAFWKEDWLENMGVSPRYRIYELINTFSEYLHKPYYVFFGKGFLGTMKDYNNYFGTVYTEGGFSEAEWSIMSFYSVHETFNGVLLIGGLFGLFMYISVFWTFIKNSRKSLFLIIGSVWFLLLYGYSMTISVFGIIAFIIGLLDLKKNNRPFFKH